MKKYPSLAALVPAGEHFDEAAILNEGGYLTVAHLAATEAKLTADAAAATKATTDLTAANAAKTKAEGELATATTTIGTQKTEIDALKAKVTELEKKPAAGFQATNTTVDATVPGATPVVDAKAKYRMSIDVEAEKYAPKS
jgi:hypothetical protein